MQKQRLFLYYDITEGYYSTNITNLSSLLRLVLLIGYRYGNVLELTAVGIALGVSVKYSSKIRCLTASRYICLFLSSL